MSWAVSGVSVPGGPGAVTDRASRALDGTAWSRQADT
jgi:hypothetical protein